jgi:hypothetical protein
VEHCARRLSPFLAEVANVDRAFRAWSRVDDPDGPYRIPINEERLINWLLKDMSRRDIDGKIMQELGFRVYVTAADTPPFPLYVHCGCNSPWVGNVCSIRFPSSGATASRILRLPTLLKLSEIMIRYWDPGHGVITCDAASPEPGGSTDFSLQAGWLTYLGSEKYHRIPKVESPARLLDVGSGQLIIATDELFSSGNLDHLASLGRIASMIRENQRG